MWTERNRARYDRSKLRYPSDVTDEEWRLVSDPARKARWWQADGQHARGRERSHVCALHRVPVARDPERPAAPKSTVYDYFGLWT
jgi:hypothetical protein